jgi:integrase
MIALRPQPRQDIIRLSEQEISRLKETARQLGVFYELFTSLGVDNGLRPVDQLNLTEQNAVEFLQQGWSVIRRKGRGAGNFVRHYLHDDTYSPLYRYLEWRQQLVDRHGQKFPQLLLMETNWRGKGSYYVRPVYYLVLYQEHQRLAEASGVTLDLRDERATFGYRGRRQGLAIEDVAELMAHKSINTAFRHYVGDSDESKMKNMRRIGGNQDKNLGLPIKHPMTIGQSRM